jgi:hypothetical protein
MWEGVMLKNKKQLCDFKEEIKAKYGYDEGLAETIAMTAESCIDYMGEEYADLIFEAISSCKYVVAVQQKDKKGNYKLETIYDVAKREGLIEEDEDSLVNDGDLKRASGAYISKPNLSYSDGEFKIDSVDREIILPYYFDPDGMSSLATISHETKHLIKAFAGEYKIEGNKLHARNGVGGSDYELTESNGKVHKKLVNEIGVGFEEGVNSYDELCLMRECYDSNYEVYGYTSLRITAGYLMDALKLRDMIKFAQLTGNIEELKALFDANMDVGFEGFLKISDKNAELEYRRFATLLDPEASKEALDNLERHFIEEIVPRTKEFGTKIQGLSEEYGLKQSA